MVGRVVEIVATAVFCRNVIVRGDVWKLALSSNMASVMAPAAESAYPMRMQLEPYWKLLRAISSHFE